MTICLFIASGGNCIEIFIWRRKNPVVAAEGCVKSAVSLRERVAPQPFAAFGSDYRYRYRISTKSAGTHLRNRLGQQAQARAVHAGHVGAARTDHVHAVLLA